MRRYDTLLKNTKNAREDLRRRNPGKSEAEIDNILSPITAPFKFATDIEKGTVKR